MTGKQEWAVSVSTGPGEISEFDANSARVEYFEAAIIKGEPVNGKTITKLSVCPRSSGLYDIKYRFILIEQPASA